MTDAQRVGKKETLLASLWPYGVSCLIIDMVEHCEFDRNSTPLADSFKHFNGADSK